MPRLFEESKRLVTAALLVAPQTIEFFQAALVLSLWSTTIGRVPLSIDSWLLTGYALQQALASPVFHTVLRKGATARLGGENLDVWCIWNHLCLAHLQYCVGMRRQVLLREEQLKTSFRLAELDNATNFESRMVAEVKLYWIIYERCCASRVSIPEVKIVLDKWQQECSSLFRQYFFSLFVSFFSFPYPLKDNPSKQCSDK